LKRPRTSTLVALALTIAMLGTALIRPAYANSPVRHIAAFGAPETSPVDMSLGFAPGLVLPESSHDISFTASATVNTNLNHSTVEPNDSCSDASTHPLLPSHSATITTGAALNHSASPFFYNGANGRSCWYQTIGDFYPTGQPKHVFVAAAGIVPGNRSVDLRGSAELVAQDAFVAGSTALLRVHGSSSELKNFDFSGVTSPCATNLPYQTSTDPIIGFNWTTVVTLTAAVVNCPFTFDFSVSGSSGETISTKTVLYATISPGAEPEPDPLPTGSAAFNEAAPVYENTVRGMNATVTALGKPIGLSNVAVQSDCFINPQVAPPTGTSNEHRLLISATMIDIEANRVCEWGVSAKIVGGDHNGETISLHTQAFTLHATQATTMTSIFLPIAMR
jgi:hypothetical protein